MESTTVGKQVAVAIHHEGFDQITPKKKKALKPKQPKTVEDAALAALADTKTRKLVPKVRKPRAPVGQGDPPQDRQPIKKPKKVASAVPDPAVKDVPKKVKKLAGPASGVPPKGPKKLKQSEGQNDTTSIVKKKKKPLLGKDSATGPGTLPRYPEPGPAPGTRAIKKRALPKATRALTDAKDEQGQILRQAKTVPVTKKSILRPLTRKSVEPHNVNANQAGVNRPGKPAATSQLPNPKVGRKLMERSQAAASPSISARPFGPPLGAVIPRKPVNPGVLSAAVKVSKGSLQRPPQATSAEWKPNVIDAVDTSDSGLLGKIRKTFKKPKPTTTSPEGIRTGCAPRLSTGTNFANTSAQPSKGNPIVGGQSRGIDTFPGARQDRSLDRKTEAASPQSGLTRPAVAHKKVKNPVNSAMSGTIAKVKTAPLPSCLLPAQTHTPAPTRSSRLQAQVAPLRRSNAVRQNSAGTLRTMQPDLHLDCRTFQENRNYVTVVQQKIEQTNVSNRSYNQSHADHSQTSAYYSYSAPPVASTGYAPYREQDTAQRLRYDESVRSPKPDHPNTERAYTEQNHFGWSAVYAQPDTGNEILQAEYREDSDGGQQEEVENDGNNSFDPETRFESEEEEISGPRDLYGLGDERSVLYNNEGDGEGDEEEQEEGEEEEGEEGDENDEDDEQDEGDGEDGENKEDEENEEDEEDEEAMASAESGSDSEPGQDLGDLEYGQGTDNGSDGEGSESDDSDGSIDSSGKDEDDEEERYDDDETTGYTLDEEEYAEHEGEEGCSDGEDDVDLESEGAIEYGSTSEAEEDAGDEEQGTDGDGDGDEDENGGEDSDQEYEDQEYDYGGDMGDEYGGEEYEIEEQDEDDSGDGDEDYEDEVGNGIDEQSWTEAPFEDEVEEIDETDWGEAGSDMMAGADEAEYEY